MMAPLYLIVALVVLQRLTEMQIAAHNTCLLKAEGAIEVGARHYPLFILLHTSWLLAILLTTPIDVKVNLWLFSAFLMLQLGRVWVIATLGRFWTTRIISVPNAPLIRTGPYRFVSHPNYIIVTGEIALLPLVFNNWPVAIMWSLLNALLLAWRIRLESTSLAERKRL